MEEPDLGKIVIKEIAVVSSCAGAAFGIDKFLPGPVEWSFVVKLGGILYLASIAIRLAGIFLKITIKAAFILGIIGIALVLLAARYPSFFAFLKK